MTFRRWGVVALALAVFLGLGALVWRGAHSPPSPAPSDIGGAFHLTDQTGAKVDETMLNGKWSAVFFGYTYCPDVCPTTLSRLGAVVAALGAQASRFQVVFITVDPERDTPGALATYLSSPTFPPGARGLTGSADQIAAVAKAYRVYYQKVPQGGSYTMDHSAVIYLMDPKGRFVGPLDLTPPAAEVAERIRSAMAGAPGI